MQYTTIFVSMGPQLRRCASWFGGPRSTSTVSISSISCHEQDKNHTNAMNIYLLWRYIHLRPPNRRGSFPYNPFCRVRRRGFQVLCQRAPRDVRNVNLGTWLAYWPSKFTKYLELRGLKYFTSNAQPLV